MTIKTNFSIGDLILMQRCWLIGILIGLTLPSYFLTFNLIPFLFAITLTLSPVIFSIIYSLLKKGVLGEHTIEITPNFMRKLTNYNDDYYEWQKIKKICKDKYYIYIIINNFKVLSLRNKDFTTEEEFDECFALIQNYHNQASKGDNSTNN